MPSQHERTEMTRAALCAAFRKSLLEKGLEATTTAGVLADTGLSKGALYHHFNSKTDIMEAVYRDESHGAVRRAIAAVPAGLSPIEQLKHTCHAWLSEMEDHDVGSIVMEIGPTALGFERVLEIENELTLPMFEATLRRASKEGQISIPDPLLAARLINGMVAQIALQPASERADAAKTMGPLVEAILEGLAA